MPTMTSVVGGVCGIGGIGGDASAAAARILRDAIEAHVIVHGHHAVVDAMPMGDHNEAATVRFGVY